jgi:hypothetical protein
MKCPRHKPKVLLIVHQSRFKTRFSGEFSSQQALSLPELLVASLIIISAIVGAYALVDLGFIGLKRSESNYDLQNLIDRDISKIEYMADRYTCTQVGCEIKTTLPAKNEYITFAGATVLSDGSILSDGSALSTFNSRCVQTDSPDINGQEDLVTPLANYIEQGIPVPPGLFRVIQVHGSGSASNVGIGRIKHLTVQYRKGSQSGVTLRNTTIIPTIVSYCP